MPALSAILTDPDLGGTTFYVFRPSYTRETGEVLPSCTAGFIVSGNIQPAASEDLLLFPEEERSEDMIVIFSTFHFSLGESEGATFTSADIINWHGTKYRVIRVKNWSNQGGYYKAWAVRQRDSETVQTIPEPSSP